MIQKERKGRAVQDVSVIGSVDRIMKGIGVSMEVKKELRDSKVLPSLTYASEISY